MRSIIVVIVLLLCLAGLGFYRGWFTLSSRNQDVDNNKVEVSLTVDPDKVKDDVETVKDKTKELGTQTKEKLQSKAERDETIQRIDSTQTSNTIRVRGADHELVLKGSQSF